MAKKKHGRNDRKTVRFSRLHPTPANLNKAGNRSVWAAKKAYNKQAKKQTKNVRRGKAGRTPIKRKILNSHA